MPGFGRRDPEEAPEDHRAHRSLQHDPETGTDQDYPCSAPCAQSRVTAAGTPDYIQGNQTGYNQQGNRSGGPSTTKKGQHDVVWTAHIEVFALLGIIFAHEPAGQIGAETEAEPRISIHGFHNHGMPPHDAESVVVTLGCGFVIVLGGVLATVNLLGRLVPGSLQQPGLTNAPFWSAPTTANDFGRKQIYAVVLGAAILAVAAVNLTRHFDTLPLRSDSGILLNEDGIDPVPLPAFIGVDWIGRTAPVSAIEREILPPDTGYSRRTYVALHQPGHGVFLSIVLSGRDRTSIHRPELCVTGQGWTIHGQTKHQFQLDETGALILPATLLHLVQDDPRNNRQLPALIAYWFVNSERVVATHWERMFWGAWDRLRHGRADRWAYVLVQTDAVDGEAAALSRMQEVLKGTVPEFQRSLPAN